MAQAHRSFRINTGNDVVAAHRENHVELSLSILRDFFGDAFARDFSVRLWDGTCVRSSGPEQFIFRVNAPYALRAAFMPPLDLNPGRAFVHEFIDCDGDVEAVVAAVERASALLPAWRMAALALKVAMLPPEPREGDGTVAQLRGKAHTPGRDREAVGYHYDQPASFYRTFLDENLVYSCAYFSRGEAMTLDEAQIAKLDHVLTKLRVAPGDRLLDIGCGFGALAIRAAERFGASVTGITLSRTQHEEARRRVGERGLDDRVSIELRDYRELDGRRYDKVTSVGMVEHVGRERLNDYFRLIFKLLRPGGLFLNHGIADQSPKRTGYRAGSDFIGRYVFPDGDLVPIGQLLSSAERAGFEVRDVESLREHYAKTLRTWHERLLRNAGAAIAASSETTLRIFNLYLAGSAHGFAAGRMNVFQTLLVKPYEDGHIDLPATRAGGPPLDGSKQIR